MIMRLVCLLRGHAPRYAFSVIDTEARWHDLWRCQRCDTLIE